MANLITMITELVSLERRVETAVSNIKAEIKKEKNAKTRRKMSKAYRKRDAAALRKLWFK